MLFLGNASGYRKNKLHFLSNDKFLINILNILDSEEFPLKVKAFTSQTLCVTMNNHQGVKGSWRENILKGVADIKNQLEKVTLNEIAAYEGVDKENQEFWMKQERYRDITIRALNSLLQ